MPHRPYGLSPNGSTCSPASLFYSSPTGVTSHFEFKKATASVATTYFNLTTHDSRFTNVEFNKATAWVATASAAI